MLKLIIMENLAVPQKNLNEAEYLTNERDIRQNWVSSSRFLFYIKIVGICVFLLSTCVALFVKRYPGKPDVEVQKSSQYTPSYQ